MIEQRWCTTDDIAALPHGEGKAIALSLWKRLQIVDKAFRIMAADIALVESQDKEEVA